MTDTPILLVGLLCAYIGFTVGVMLDIWVRKGDDDEDDDGSWVPDYPPDDLADDHEWSFREDGPG